MKERNEERSKTFGSKIMIESCSDYSDCSTECDNFTG
jgi:hypothetical protein